MEWWAGGVPDHLTEALVCEMHAQGAEKTESPSDAWLESGGYVLIKRDDLWALVISKYSADKGLAAMFSDPVKAKISVDGAVDDMFFEFEAVRGGHFEAPLSNIEIGGGTVIRIELPASYVTKEAPRVDTVYLRVYEWRFDHWSYAAGQEFCEKTRVKEDDGWF